MCSHSSEHEIPLRSFRCIGVNFSSCLLKSTNSSLLLRHLWFITSFPTLIELSKVSYVFGGVLRHFLQWLLPTHSEQYTLPHLVHSFESRRASLPHFWQRHWSTRASWLKYLPPESGGPFSLILELGVVPSLTTLQRASSKGSKQSSDTSYGTIGK